MPFGNFATLTHFQVDKFSQIFKNVFVSSKFEKFDPPLNLIKDKVADDFSPMLALASVLENFKDEHIFIIPADMPFVNENTIRELYKFTPEFDIVIPQDDSHTHSLCGFFNSNLADKAKEFYEKGEHKIGLLHSVCKCKKVKFNDEKEFFNINYPNEYEIARSKKL